MVVLGDINIFKGGTCFKKFGNHCNTAFTECALMHETNKFSVVFGFFLPA